MCGRYTLKTPKARLDAHFGVDLPEMERYNIAPSQPVPAITSDAVKVLKWGLQAIRECFALFLGT